MTNQIFISFFFFFVVLTASAFSQSARATMRVSVEVVSAMSVEVVKPARVVLSADRTSSLGTLTINSGDNRSVLIRNSGKIDLVDSRNQKITLKVQSKREKIEENVESIQFGGRPKRELLSSTYRGELKTTIEYL